MRKDKRRIGFPEILFVFVIIILFLHNSYTQEADYYLGLSRYSFINYDTNKFLFPGNKFKAEEFFDQFDSLIHFGNKQINIVHVGGSHIQTDIYTHVVRKHLQGLTPDMNGGRGLLFPYKIAHTNGPLNYKVSYTGEWEYNKSTQHKRHLKTGLTGYAVSTSDSIAEICINPNSDPDIKYHFNGIRVYHEFTSYRISVCLTDSAYFGTYNSYFGYTSFNLNKSYDSLCLKVVSDTIDDSFTLQGILPEYSSPGIVYHTVGVNGAKLKSYLQSEYYIKHLESIKPEMVIFSVGTNDAYTRRFDAKQYRKEYHQLIDSTLKAVPDVFILLTVPNDSYLYKKYVNTNTATMRTIIYDLAEEYGCGVWDFYTIMGGLNSSRAWNSLNLMKYDLIHFNKEGYILKGELFFSAFLKSWEERLESPLSSYPDSLIDK
ncbi:MAG: hypothetical protein JW894_14705 [Bacteroidales bacterium]|nr:hypothetical protein [Bacteroidales bacterium]